MKTGVMQPYLFPYLGYWQLVYVVDQFILLDDVNYIKRGYINRNRILFHGEACLLTLPLDHPSQNKLIKDTKICNEKKNVSNILSVIKQAYHRAPEFNEVFPVIEDILQYNTLDLTEFIQNSLIAISHYLGIHTDFIRSSHIGLGKDLRGEERIIEICKRCGTNLYINPAGGRGLYSKVHFENAGMKLLFIDMCHDKINYGQFGNEFIDNLSIIDVMMFNNKHKISELLQSFRLNEE